MKSREQENKSEDLKQMIKQLGIVEEGDIVSEQDLEGKEEVIICREPTTSSWRTDEN